MLLLVIGPGRDTQIIPQPTNGMTKEKFHSAGTNLPVARFKGNSGDQKRVSFALMEG
jgi:hypothetical protein